MGNVTDNSGSSVLPCAGVPSPSTPDHTIRVSVIIPTYNHVKVLMACLDALLKQDYDHARFEVVAVDDGSSDGTSLMVESYATAHPELSLRCITQANQGPAAARNKGARHARGEIIIFTDDDCVPQPDWISRMVQPFDRTDVRIDGVKGAYRTRQKGIIARFAQLEFESRYSKMINAEFIDFVDTYSAAFRKDTFLALDGFDTSFPLANNEDVEFSYRMAASGYKMVFAPDAIVYHTHPDTLWKYLRVKFGRAYWRMAVYKSFPEKMHSDSYTPQSLKIQIIMVFLLMASMLKAYLTGIYVTPFVLAGVYLLTMAPFLLGLVNPGVLARLSAFMHRFLKKGFLKLIKARLVAMWQASLPARALGLLMKWIRLLMRGVLSLLRRILCLPLWRVVFRAIRGIVLLSGRTITRLWSGLVFILELPGKVFHRTVRWIYHAIKWLATLPVFVKLQKAVEYLGTTRIVMLPLAVIVIFLRSIAMGCGIIWAIRSVDFNKARFSQFLALLTGDAMAVTAAYIAAFHTRASLPWLQSIGPAFIASTYSQFLLPLLVIMPAVLYLSGLYKPYKGLSQVNEFVLLVRSVTTVSVLVIIAIYLSNSMVSRVIVVLTGIYTIFFIALTRVLIRLWFEKYAIPRRIGDKTRVLMVGTGEIAQLICNRLKGTSALESEIIGMVDSDPARIGQTVGQYHIIGTFDDISDIINNYAIQEVFVTLPSMPQKDVIDLVSSHSRKEGVRFHIVSNLFDLISAEIDIAEHNNIPIACLQNENMAIIHLAVKRMIDIAVSFMLIMLTLPAWIVIMIAIRLETDGPAIFRQERVGKNGRIFHVYKFRTMYTDTPKFEYSPSEAGDSRITRAGRFLRKTSMDEFPQFLNILKGDMSLVGPRPEMPFIVAKYNEWEKQRLKVKPGLTGLWQIMGRKDLPLHESLEYDFYYIKNQSLLLDFSILLKTIPTILKGKGAY